MKALGIDIGGSAIKGAPVNLRTGRLLAERHRIATPRRLSPAQMAGAVREIVRHFDWHGPVGIGFPGVIAGHRILTSANLHPKFIGCDGVVFACELGHFPWEGKSAEKFVAASARDREDLSWPQWGRRLGKYLRQLEALLWPERIIIGGGASAKHRKFFPYLKTNATLAPAELLNGAGIVGAALWAARAKA
jgi:polyphosphate glucokinase